MADNIQHGIDDNPSGDAEKGAKLGGVGGAVTGLVAGAAAGPVGAVVGAVIGGVAGAVASGAAVAAVDRVDNDNTVTGIGGGSTTDSDHYRSHHSSTYGTTGRDYDTYEPSYQYGNDLSRDSRYSTGDYTSNEASIRSDYESKYPGSSYDDNSQAIRTGYDRGRGIDQVSAGTKAEEVLGGNGIPGIQTGGTNPDGSPDQRGITEKIADTVTGNDDRTSKTY